MKKLRRILVVSLAIMAIGAGTTAFASDEDLPPADSIVNEVQ
ncbi:hypothetical protein JOC86_000598 [Bacillus pakistanensis]|uniref:Uncharacterized protein n=1 Tax=Rossellomorea pakistanensis TaxID=992288 RepID=A0ABS2N883_9BACI|nr:hypothetical protein [Bacillus pakistanensis]MBM7584061.1 hypothetical protein [Bacillus pakistanensis]